jgi:hypothetical protein
MIWDKLLPNAVAWLILLLNDQQRKTTHSFNVVLNNKKEEKCGERQAKSQASIARYSMRLK